MPLLVDPYETGVLDETVHHRLVADLQNIADDAMIHPKWVWTRLSNVVSEAEVDWVRHFHKNTAQGITGLALVGATPGAAASHIPAIAGALLRNFIRAQVFTTAQLYASVKEGDVPNPSCLLLPNFFLGKSYGSTPAHWEITALQDVLMNRHMRGNPTVLYATDLNAMAQEYGAGLAQIVKDNYQIIKVGSD